MMVTLLHPKEMTPATTCAECSGGGYRDVKKPIAMTAYCTCAAGRAAARLARERFDREWAIEQEALDNGEIW